ncbi:hypothetical protein CCACVL1_29761 [Corchorus capsularis]|uniref:Uncharacterized protein n=1 Tax=Corchorus capsularis TaxID=210143 RepID=A0A1R3G0A7_COCAP|nr:hypothetical protein CCACVL1_29761 [Corchorus capsularis]
MAALTPFKGSNAKPTGKCGAKGGHHDLKDLAAFAFGASLT